MESFKCLSFFLLFLLLPSSNSISFQVPNFTPSLNYIHYQGDAKPSLGNVELTDNTEPYRVGLVKYANEVLIWDSNSGKVSDFTCRFSFNINGPSSTGGDGIVFFLAPVEFQIPLNSRGGYLALFNTTTRYSSSNMIISVEFDTLQNFEWDPMDVQSHVGININSLRSIAHTPWNASSYIEDTTNVLITYNSSTENLSVSWSYQNTRNPQEKTMLSYPIKLRKVLSPWVTIGFSACTGLVLGRHTLKSWEFNSSLDANKETNENSSRTIKIIVFITIVVIVLLTGISLAYVIMRQRKKVNKKAKMTNVTSINDDFEMGTGPRRFSYQGLASATNCFSQDRKLGEGGFGTVYRGYLADVNMSIAVKKISKGSKQGKREYVTEVKIISQLRHRNLVQLIGWCHERREFLLVYEYMSNGSLDSHLFGKRSPLPWHIRYRITLGLTSAILYLHEEWEQCVVHRDIKSSNIMLDSNFNVKLGDFGLAKLMDHELGQITTGLAGTFGYLAPEYISTRKASKESDVFSFGVVILEIVTGRKSTDRIGEEFDLGLVEWVWDLYGKGRLHSGVDERVKRDFDEKQAECLMIVGMWCSHPDSSSRPSIKLAIQVLNFEATMPNLPIKMPIPMYHVPTPLVNTKEPSIPFSSVEVGR